MNKKAQDGHTLTIIVIVVLGLIILVVAVVTLGGRIGIFSDNTGGKSCEKLGGICPDDASYSCKDDSEGRVHKIITYCEAKKKTMACCVKNIYGGE